VTLGTSINRSCQLITGSIAQSAGV